MNAISLLCEIIAQGGKVVSNFYPKDALDALVRHGFLREAGRLCALNTRCRIPCRWLLWMARMATIAARAALLRSMLQKSRCSRPTYQPSSIA